MDPTKKIKQTGKDLQGGAKKAYADKTDIAISVLAVTAGIIFGVMVMQTTAMKGNRSASTITESSAWASDRVERIFALDSSDLSDVDADGTGGLSDSGCCQSGADPFGTTVSGCTAKADDCDGAGEYAVYWNVAGNSPMSGTKTIRVLVKKTERGVERTLQFDYVKSDLN